MFRVIVTRTFEIPFETLLMKNLYFPFHHNLKYKQAVNDLREAAQQASTDGRVPSETQEMLKNALDGNWGAGDLVCT